MSGVFPVFIVLIVAVIVLVAVGAHRSNVKRQESMAAYAAARGWSYEQRRPELARRVGLARPSYGDNVIEGVLDGHPFVAFDHVRYESDGDNGQRSVPVSVVAVNLGVAVPQLEITRQGAFSRFFTDLFGTDHLVGDKVFDDAVRIRTNSPGFTAEVLTQPMKTLLLSRLDRSWRFSGDNLLTVADGKHTPAQLESVLATCLQMVASIPPGVWARLQAGAAGLDAPAAPVVDAPVADAPVAPVTDAVPPQPLGPQAPTPGVVPAPPSTDSRSSLLEESVGWSIDPITGKRTSR